MTTVKPLRFRIQLWYPKTLNSLFYIALIYYILKIGRVTKKIVRK